MTPHLHIMLQHGPLLEPPSIDAASLAGCGAVGRFEGVVRGHEHGRPIQALRYEVYEPMTSRQLRELCEDISKAYALHVIVLQHSVGDVPVGEVSFRLLIASPHRKEVLSAMDELINRMKRDVAIWKQPQWTDADASPGGPA